MTLNHDCRFHLWNLLSLPCDFLKRENKKKKIVKLFHPCRCRIPPPHRHPLLGWSNGQSVGSCWPLIWLSARPITPPAEKAYVVLEEAAGHQLHIFARQFKKKLTKKGKCCILSVFKLHFWITFLLMTQQFHFLSVYLNSYNHHIYK